MTLPYRNTLRTITEERLLRINAQERRTGEARFRPVAETISSIEAANAPSEAMLGAWATHPDERVPIALLISWDRILGDNVVDDLNDTIWETLNAQALRIAAEEGVSWTPLLDAIGCAREASPRTTGGCDYSNLSDLKSWIALQCDPACIEALLQFKLALVRHSALLRLALLKPQRIAALRSVNRMLPFEVIDSAQCTAGHVDELARQAVEDIRHGQDFIPTPLPPIRYQFWGMDAACMGALVLRKLAAEGYAVDRRHVTELARMALSNSAMGSARPVSMAARHWSREALLNLGTSVPAGVLEKMYETRVRRSDATPDVIRQFTLHPSATLWMLNDLANRADDEDTIAWDDLAKAALAQATPDLRGRIVMHASHFGLKSLAKFCNVADWRAIFRRITSSRKGYELLRTLDTVLAMARRDQLEGIKFSDWRRLLRAARCDAAIATRVLTRIPSACRHELGQQQISTAGNPNDWMMLLHEMSGDTARALFQKLATESAPLAAQTLRKSPHLLSSLRATDLLPLLEWKGDQRVREVAMDAFAVVSAG